ncbi:hypothetical protein G9A89_003315 [Geosiphon pyriformis]|nr:hypothetical protein G9A89_003315 [Geosiphon pyriformis]
MTKDITKYIQNENVHEAKNEHNSKNQKIKYLVIGIFHIISKKLKLIIRKGNRGHVRKEGSDYRN